MPNVDELLFDAEALEAAADTIERYCNDTKSTMGDFVSNVAVLSESWRDDKTFGTMYEYIDTLRKMYDANIDLIAETYTKFFRDRAAILRARPQLQSQSGGKIHRVEQPDIYVQISPKVIVTEIGHKNLSYKFTRELPLQSISDYRGYIKESFNIAGCSKSMLSLAEQAFADAPELALKAVYNYTDRLELKTISGESCYIPSWMVQKSLIKIDPNIPNQERIFQKLLGHHIYYWTDLSLRQELADGLVQDLKQDNFTTNKYAQSLKEEIRCGDLLKCSEDEDISSKKYHFSSNFFAECFSAYVRKDKDRMNELELYFNNGFKVFCNIMNHSSDANVRSL